MQDLRSVHVSLDMGRKSVWWGPDLLEPIARVVTPQKFDLDIQLRPGILAESTEEQMKSIEPFAGLPCTVRRVPWEHSYSY